MDALFRNEECRLLRQLKALALLLTRANGRGLVDRADLLRSLILSKEEELHHLAKKADFAARSA